MYLWPQRAGRYVYSIKDSKTRSYAWPTTYKKRAGIRACTIACPHSPCMIVYNIVKGLYREKFELWFLGYTHLCKILLYYISQKCRFNVRVRVQQQTSFNSLTYQKRIKDCKSATMFPNTAHLYMDQCEKFTKKYQLLKGQGPRDLIWLKVVSLGRSWWVGLTEDP